MGVLQTSFTSPPLSSNSFLGQHLAPFSSLSPLRNSLEGKKCKPNSHLFLMYLHWRRRGKRLDLQLCPSPRRATVFKVKAALVKANAKAIDFQVPSEGESSSYSSSLVIGRDNNASWDRTSDMQVEAKAMTRAAEVSTYSPELLSSKYGSCPLKVVRSCKGLSRYYLV